MVLTLPLQLCYAHLR